MFSYDLLLLFMTQLSHDLIEELTEMDFIGNYVPKLILFAEVYVAVATVNLSGFDP